MAVRSSGQLGLRSDIQAEFGGPTTNIPISRYWRGGSYVLDIPANAAVPTGGESKWSNWYSSTSAFYYNYTLAAGQYATNLNILNAVLAAGYENNGSRPAIVNVTIAGIMGSINETYALDTGASAGWSLPPTITIGVSGGGFITGCGGGPGDTPAWGGNALRLQLNTTLINNGIIQAGGGRGTFGAGNCHGGGCGYVAGPGIGGPGGYTNNPSGTLESGGAQQYGGGKKSPEGGAGGGWVSNWTGNYESTSINGFGQDTAGGSVVPPGTAIMGWSTYALGGSVYGVVRGYVDSSYVPPPPPPPPTGPPPTFGGGGICFGPGTQILTPDGWYVIQELEVGTMVVDQHGNLTEVVGVKRRQVDQTPIYEVAGVSATADHLFLTDRGWACVDPEIFAIQRQGDKRYQVMSNGLVIDQLGLATTEQIKRLEPGDIIKTHMGQVRLDRIEPANLTPADYVYAVSTRAGTMVIDYGMIVEAYIPAKSQN